MKYPIVFIGPMCSGKSTIANLLSNKLKVQNVPMDYVRWYYYLKAGYSLQEEKKFNNFEDLVKHWKPFELKAIKQIFIDFPHSIIDFGAGHSHFTNQEQLDEAKLILNDIENVILLLPSKDKKKSIEVLNERLKTLINKEQNRNPTESEYKQNIEFINSESNIILSKKIIYTEGKSIEEIANEVLKRIYFH